MKRFLQTKAKGHKMDIEKAKTALKEKRDYAQKWLNFYREGLGTPGGAPLAYHGKSAQVFAYDDALLTLIDLEAEEAEKEEKPEVVASVPAHVLSAGQNEGNAEKYTVEFAVSKETSVFFARFLYSDLSLLVSR